MSAPAMPGREEHALLAAPGRDAAITAVVVVLTAGIFAAVGDHGTLTSIQRTDDAWLRLMASVREVPLTAIARGFSILGLVYVTLPVRIAIAGFLALRRRWWHLAAFAVAVVTSEVLIGVLKGIYDRARPPGSLVTTTAASFPSGHAVAAAHTPAPAFLTEDLSMTPEAIRDGFHKLRSGAEMTPLADAAVCRSESDWLVGINGTRAMTAFNSSFDKSGFSSTSIPLARKISAAFGSIGSEIRTLGIFFPSSSRRRPGSRG